MNYLRSEAERGAFRRVFYPGTEVYRNKFDIRDAGELEQVERELTLTPRDGKKWNDASRAGFMRSDHSPMAALLSSRLRPH